ncbi:2-dehydropantoate 2-reductase N-terminal domain-containing protein [Saccharibacillus sp. CPCC 101409]|uniref:ketopantoate reductase family protein n=1 Tax=Saccharibacillus sp. CPCC 101409 TaxID=3058041 RepID=UPI00267126B7|nr:2-dehydropantoate 2-reductase N-terminal domain-containing protein [Saccharibacillus sp. CPCC 101409]MDO3411518.1 2-dehydropantoate 2-reductase N-terminal domain-containing protein [Saccharibacillus sp. CPCC 101409]
MRVLVYGMGNQGSLLAHTLVNGGNDVTVLARGERAEQFKEKGIVIRHFIQRKTTIDKVKVITELEARDRYDVIFVVMKYSDFKSVLPVLAVNETQNILLVGNNFNPAEMKAYMKSNSINEKNMAFGFQMSGGKKDKDRITVLRTNAGEMVLGALGEKIEFQSMLEAIFAKTKYKLSFQDDIDAWFKNHIIYVLPLNLAHFIKDYDYRSVGKDNALLKEVVKAMHEGFDLLVDLGYHNIPKGQANFATKHEYLNFLFYKLYHFTPMVKQSESSFIEIKAFYDELYKLKAASGFKTPSLDKLVKQAEKKYLLNK